MSPDAILRLAQKGCLEIQMTCRCTSGDVRQKDGQLVCEDCGRKVKLFVKHETTEEHPGES